MPIPSPLGVSTFVGRAAPFGVPEPADSPAAPPPTILSALAGHARRQGHRTAYTFLKSDDERPEVTYAELDRRARAIAAALLRRAEPGDRALLTYPTGLEFVEAFLGCLYAGVVAVPAYPPKRNRNAERVLAIARDCGPRLLLCAAETKANLLGEFAAAVPGAEVLATDELDAPGPAAGLPDVTPDRLAFLQYTSGSTADPKGVMVTHANVAANERLIQEYFDFSDASVMVSWLPMFHDMGLVGSLLQPLFVGFPCYLMAPTAFVRQPERWLEAITEFRGVFCGGPNFAYDLCTRKVTEETKRRLDLSTWVAFNGAEPVQAATLERFARAFEPCGFRADAFLPCYGMAEATLFVSGGPPRGTTRVVRLDPKGFERHEVREAAEGQAVVSCGRPGGDLRVRIVHPERCSECLADEIGEIWVSGASVADGYWNRPDETAAAFRARLPGLSQAWLRTGDYGFLRDGEIYVTGRLKDLIITRGRNIYPQDVERLVAAHLDFLAPNSCAAFSISGDGVERLAVVAEGTRNMVRSSVPALPGDAAAPAPNEKVESLRTAILERFDVPLTDLVFVRPASFPRTSSGKVQRALTKAMFLGGDLDIVHDDTFRPTVASSGVAPPCSPLGVVYESVREWADEEGRPLPPLVPDARLATLGIDSVAAMDIAVRLEVRLGVPVDVDLLYRNPTFEALARSLVAVGDRHRSDLDEIEVRAVASAADLTAIGRLRYRVTVEEMKLDMTHVRHADRTVVEPLDVTGRVFGAWQSGRVIGTVRSNYLRESDVGYYHGAYDVDGIPTYVHRDRISVTTRLAVAEAFRATGLASKLVEAAYRQGLENGMTHDVMDCRKRLVPYFRRLGYVVHVDDLRHPEFGDVTVLYLPMRDARHLEASGSPLLQVLKAYQERTGGGIGV